MANYPSSNPSIANAGVQLSTNPHSTLHDSMRDEILAIAVELGLTPSGGYSTVKARLDDMQTRSGCHLTRSTNLTLAATSTTDVTFTDEVEDTDAYISVTGSTVTIPSGKAGLYAITASVDLDVTTADYLDIVVNGVTVKNVVPLYNGEVAVGSVIVPLAVADTVKCRVYNSGAAGNISSAELFVYRVGV